MKQIYVNVQDLGFWTEEDITVQRFTDDGLVWCNHAGAVEQVRHNQIDRIDEPDITWEDKALVCDKCIAYKIDGEDYWAEAPELGAYHE